MAVNLINNEQIHVIQDGSNITLDIQGEALKNKNAVVGSIRSKNIFNKTNIINNAFINGSTNKIDTSNTTKCVYVEIEGGKTYTVSKTAGTRFAVGTSTVFPEIETTLSGVIQNYISSQITISTSSTAKYLVAYVYNSDTDTITLQQMLDSIQIEEGSTATTYSPYQNLTGEENYSTEEQVIGTYIDGKPVYKKTISVSKSSSGMAYMNIDNIGVIVSLDTYLVRSDNYKNTGNWGQANTDFGTFFVDISNKLQFNSNYTGTVYITIKYTKATD